MIHLQGREAEKHIEKFKIKELPFELVVYSIIKIKNKYPKDIQYAYIGAEFIARDTTNGEYYLATWGSGKSNYTEMYTFNKINFELYHSYLKSDISYHKFRFESLKINDVVYRMRLYNRQFCKGDIYTKGDKPEIIFKVGNLIEYSEGYAINFANMCSYYMTIPYENRKEYEPLGFTCEKEAWNDSNVYKAGQKKRHDRNPEIQSFVKMMQRAKKVSEILD